MRSIPMAQMKETKIPEDDCLYQQTDKQELELGPPAKAFRRLYPSAFSTAVVQSLSSWVTSVPITWHGPGPNRSVRKEGA